MSVSTCYNIDNWSWTYSILTCFACRRPLLPPKFKGTTLITHNKLLQNCNGMEVDVLWGVHISTHADTETHICRPLHLHIIACVLISYATHSLSHTHRHAHTNTDAQTQHAWVLMTCACVCEGVRVCFELGRGEAEDELTMAANNYRSVVWRS